MRGPMHDAFVDGALEPGHGAAEVAHRSEAPHQRRLGLSRRQQMEVRGLGRHQDGMGVAAMKAASARR